MKSRTRRRRKSNDGRPSLLEESRGDGGREGGRKGEEERNERQRKEEI